MAKSMRTAEYFAEDEYRDYLIYRALAASEPVPEFRKILESLAASEQEHYRFWREISAKKDFRVHPFQIWLYRVMRRVLGLTFTVKFLELHVKEVVRGYRYFIETADPSVRPKLLELIDHGEHHETELISHIKEAKVAFISSIILGLNDGLIELSGALVGFSFALRQPKLVALVGLITGIAATLSMAASAYMQARQEPGKDARKSAVYTGISYLVVVLILVLPYFLFAVPVAMTVMLVAVLSIIFLVSFYISVLFERKFSRQFGEMFIFSAGVATISFVIALVFRSLSGIQI